MSLNLKVDRNRKGFARRQKRGGNGGGWFALLVLLVALGGSGYLLLQMRLGNNPDVFSAAEATTLPRLTVTPTRSFDDFVKQAETAELAGNYRKAVELYDQASRRKPNDADLHSRIARLLVFMNDPAKGEQRARKALSINVNHAPSRAVLCMAVEWQGRLDEAQAECDTAIKADPKLLIAHAYLAETLADKEDKDGALKAVQIALDIDPRSTDALRNMGYLYYVFGQYETAMSWYDRALEVNPNLPVVLVGQAKIRNLWANSSVDPVTVKINGNAAVYALTRTLELDDKNVEAHERLGEAYRILGEFDKAPLAFDKAIKLDPKRVSIYTRRGVLRFQRYDFLNAITDYTTAIALSKENNKNISAIDYTYLGYAQQWANRCGDARQTLQDAQRLYPDNGSLPGVAAEIERRCASK